MSTSASTGWQRMCFKQNKVWASVDDRDGKLLVTDGKVLIKYQLDQKHEYRVRPDSLRPLPESGDCKSDAPPEKKLARHSPGDAAACAGADDPRAIRVYTDGASSGNPGPAGIGIFLRFGPHEREISEYIGIATNNIAELEAIRRGLAEIRNPKLPVRIYTDSGYALGLLTQGWKAKNNRALVQSIKKDMLRFADLVFVKVKGHAGDPGNEKADRLATDAIRKRGED